MGEGIENHYEDDMFGDAAEFEPIRRSTTAAYGAILTIILIPITTWMPRLMLCAGRGLGD